ncbi:MAG: tetratricopeptide repeat protein [Candidatus Omnitrophota bacterium]
MLGRYVFLPLVFMLSCFHFCFAEGSLLTGEASVYYQEAVKAQRAGNFESADTSYQKVLIVDPNNTKWQKAILNNRGVMNVKIGDLETAEKLFNRALEIDPDYQIVKYNLGIIYEKRRTRLESLEYWAKMFDLEKMIPKNYLLEDYQ